MGGDCDIINVWDRSKYPRCARMLSQEDRELIYERKEPKIVELTIEDIAKKFGIEP